MATIGFEVVASVSSCKSVESSLKAWSEDETPVFAVFVLARTSSCVVFLVLNAGRSIATVRADVFWLIEELSFSLLLLLLLFSICVERVPHYVHLLEEALRVSDLLLNVLIALYFCTAADFT